MDGSWIDVLFLEERFIMARALYFWKGVLFLEGRFIMARAFEFIL